MEKLDYLLGNNINYNETNNILLTNDFFKNINKYISFDNLYINYNEYKNNLKYYYHFIKKYIYSTEIIDNIPNTFEYIGFENNFYKYKRIKTRYVGFIKFWEHPYRYIDKSEFDALCMLIDNALYEENIMICDVVFTWVFHNQPYKLQNNQKYIQWCPENISNYKYDFFDISLDNYNDFNSICYPIFFSILYSYGNKYDNIYNNTNNNVILDNFCAFIVSSSINQMRINFCEYVMKNYKNVNCYGKQLNNMGNNYNWLWNEPQQIELLSKHKFVICFENSNHNNNYYITEKILNAKTAGAIPIYWGTTKCFEIFEHDSFLFLDEPTENGFKKLLDKIIYLDNNNDEYLKVRNKRLINREKLDSIFNLDKIKKKINLNLFGNNIITKKTKQIYDKIYVIHYNKLKERKKYILNYFKENNISNYEFIEGNDYHNWDKNLIDLCYEFNKDNFLKKRLLIEPNYNYNNFNRLSYGEIDLIIKHFIVYNIINNKHNENENILILEDDAIFHNNFLEKTYELYKYLPDDYDIIYITAGCNLYTNKNNLISNKYFYKVSNFRSRTTGAYIINKKCVSRLLKTLIPINDCIDWELTYQSTINNLNIYWLEPPIIFEGSTIGTYKSSLR
jgi:GR25 family glycosyltransferase involved in LPS biosynthesis